MARNPWDVVGEEPARRRQAAESWVVVEEAPAKPAPERGLLERIGDFAVGAPGAIIDGLGKIDALGALKRGTAAPVAALTHAAGDLVDQTIQAPLRNTLGALGILPIDDPLGAAAGAQTALAAQHEMDLERQADAQRLGGRPSLAQAKADPTAALSQYVAHLGTQGIESAPLFAAAIATRNPEIAAPLLGGVTGAQEYTDLRGQGVGRRAAAEAGALSGLIETAGEGMSLPRVMGGEGSLLGSIVAEGGQEGLVQLGQQNVDDVATGTSTPVLQQLGDALDAALVGGALGGGGHVVSHAPAMLSRSPVAAPVNPTPEANPNALSPEIIAAGNAALADAPAARAARATAAVDRNAQTLGLAPEPTGDLDAMLGELVQALPPDTLAAAAQALAPQSAPAATPSPAEPPVPSDVRPQAQTSPAQLAATMRQSAQEQAARATPTTAPAPAAAVQPSVPAAGSSRAGGDLPTQPEAPAAGKLYQRGNGRNNSIAQALQLPDGTWQVRHRKAGRWMPWEHRASFDPSPTFGYRETGNAGGRVHVPGIGHVSVRQDAVEAGAKPARNPLLDLIASVGGISRADAARFGVDPAGMKARHGIRPLFSDKGVSLDGLRERLLEDGYLPPESPDAPPVTDLNDVWDLVERATRGETVAPMGDAAAWDAMQQAHAERMGYDEEPSTADSDPDEELARWYDEVAAADETADLRPGDEEELASIAELAERAAAAGAHDLDIARFDGEADAAYAARLWDLALKTEARRGTDREAEEGGVRERVRAGQAGQAAAVPEGRGPAFDLRADAAAPAGAAPEVAQSGLFAPPTRGEQVRAASQAKDASRNGLGRDLVRPEQGDGELLAGDKPVQAEVPARKPAAEPAENADARDLTAEDLTPAEREAYERAGNASLARDKAAALSRAQGEADARSRGFHDAIAKVLGDQADRVEYVRDYAGLPEALRDGVESRNAERKAEGGNVVTAALYDPASQRVFIVTSVVKTPERAVWNALHEIAGHDGLRKLLGPKLDHALQVALQNPTVKALADAIAAERKLRGDQRMLAAEEALAELAAAVGTGDFDAITSRYGVAVPEGIRARVGQAIANFVRRLKEMLDDLFGRPVFTDEDVRALLEAAREASRGEGGRNGAAVEQVGESGDITDTPAFRRWFGDSKVVDANGEPLVVYHGTAADFDAFDDKKTGTNDRGLWGRGHYFAASPGAASSYAMREGDGARVIPAFVSIQSPLVLRTGGDLVIRMPDGTDTRELTGLNLDGAKIKAIALEGGHDGVIQYRPDGSIGDVVAFRAEQIKSATGNNGDFDPAKPSILESVAESEARAENRRDEAAATLPVSRGTPGWNYDADRWEGRAGAVKQARADLQDKMLAFRDVQAQIEEQLGRAVDDAQNVYRLENLMHGRVSEAIDRIEQEQVEPLAKAMRAAKVDTATLEEYLYARHAKERNAAIAKINPKMPDGGSGMTDAEADAILARADRARLEPLARKVDAITRATRRRLLDHGLITQEAFDAMDAQYAHYVPLRGKAEARIRSQGAGARGVDSRTQPVKHALGRGAGNRASNLLGEVIGDAQRAVILAEKARVGRAAMRLVLANPNPALWEVEPVQTERKLDASGEVVERVVNDWSDPSVLAVRHKGQLYRVQFYQPELAKALNHVGVDQIGALTRAAGALNRYFSAVLTKYNPAFVPVNATRDALFGLTGMAVEHGEAAALDAAVHYLPAARAAWRHARGKTGGGQWDTWVAEFAEHGGKTGYVAMPSVEDLQRKIGSGRFGGYSPEGAAKAARAVADVIGDLNDGVENALRLSAYVTLRKRGSSAEAAAEYAKNLTVNFNRKGYLGTKLNAWFLFYNAAMQGSHRVGKLYRSPKTYAYLGALAGIQVIATLAALGMHDDDGEPLWNKVPDHVKRRNIVIVRPDGSLITIPMPYGFNVFPYAAGRIAGALADNEGQGTKLADRPAQISADVIGSAVDGLFPVPIGEGAVGLLPTALRIPVNIQTNRDDFGRPIRQDDGYAKSDVPRASMGRPDTLEVFKLTAQGLNRLGGGDKYTPPPMSAFDVAPEDIEYVLKELTGGAGQFLVDVATLGQKVTGGDYAQPAEAKDLPISKRFRSNIDEQAAQQALFYQRRDVIERSLTRVRDTFKRQGPEAAEALLAATPELRGAAFKRRKRDSDKGPAGSIIVNDGNPQIVVDREDSVFGAYKAATEAMAQRNSTMKGAYLAAPASLIPTQRGRERDAAIRTANTIRQAGQDELTRLWTRDVVGAGN